ncbi:MAG: hypothetical protein OXC81_04985 [Betaproteobacteria bacterium]|nr:hypothetical protein [Betaproteobacteria bacterium]
MQRSTRTSGQQHGGLDPGLDPTGQPRRKRRSCGRVGGQEEEAAAAAGKLRRSAGQPPGRGHQAGEFRRYRQRGRQQVVVSAFPDAAGYFRRCVLSVARVDGRSRTEYRRQHQYAPAGRRFGQRYQSLPGAGYPGRPATDEKGNVGSEPGGQRRQRRRRPVQPPQPVCRKQSGGGIGTGAAEAGAGRNPLFDHQIHSPPDSGRRRQRRNSPGSQFGVWRLHAD